MKQYRGWNYDFSQNRPVTGAWRATRHGVGICNNSEESLRRMIDTKVTEEQQRKTERERT